MKKLLLSLITMLYIAMSSGIAMDIHYCMGKQAGVDLFGKNDSGPCGNCGMKKKKAGCCSDEHKFVKLADAHKHVTIDDVAAGSFILIPTPVYCTPPAYILLTETFSGTINSSPPLHSPLFLLNCVFRI